MVLNFSYFDYAIFCWLCAVVSYNILNIQNFSGQPLRASIPCLIETRFESSGGAGGTYIYVNAQEEKDDFKSVTDRAAQTIFWTELFRGFIAIQLLFFIIIYLNFNTNFIHLRQAEVLDMRDSTKYLYKVYVWLLQYFIIYLLFYNSIICMFIFDSCFGLLYLSNFFIIFC